VRKRITWPYCFHANANKLDPFLVERTEREVERMYRNLSITYYKYVYIYYIYVCKHVCICGMTRSLRSSIYFLSSSPFLKKLLYNQLASFSKILWRSFRRNMPNLSGRIHIEMHAYIEM